MENTPQQQLRVCVVLIGYNDVTRVADAVRSALAQGPAVSEVIAVDDGSTDGSVELLRRLAADDQRLRVVARAVNSGGCGTPRNDGIDRCSAPYLMFLDSDDVLPPGAVSALLTAATEHRAEVASGLCLRRELPSGRDVPWQPELYGTPAIVERPSEQLRLVYDTLCVNKLYRTDFLRRHAIRFADGPVVYEDFAFTTRVLAAAPRIALIDQPVYVWHVRRRAARLSLSLDRSGIDNWRARLDAHRQAVEILHAAGEKELMGAACTKFLEHCLRMYLRELGAHGPEYQRAWWDLTRAYLQTFDTADLERATDPARIVGQVLLASPEPVDLYRLRQLAARPARLPPPHARAADSTPVWSEALPEVTLEHLLVRPMRLLPLAVDAELRPRARTSVLTLTLHELYGRVAAAAPTTVDVELQARDGGHPGLRRTAAWSAGTDPDPVWTAEVLLDLGALPSGVWDLRLRVRFADGTVRETTARAVPGPGLLRRRVLPDRRHGTVLVQPYATHSGSLSVRVAAGMRGVVGVLRSRSRRLLGNG
ncbi:glycosyltransferase family 2 protein [Streptomyces apocyni]|uniref:glycosyltransferase family 2 protein n=1 Tax=Streptomyces apocyni TaxID=2654677 RepID=UPI0012EAE412|nr:glycosyltransferase family 2 protein [Streptomyces apocyni]